MNFPALLKNGSLRVESATGEVLLSYRDEDDFVPASILKVATAFCAIQDLGLGYRYTTDFLLGENNTLYVRGSGDPTTVSEELAQVAEQVARSTKHVSGIVVDTSLFADNLEIDGASPSRNPYDAKNAAFVGNFSSAAVTRRRDGSVVSAEPQTPITPLSRRAGMQLKRGSTERVKIGDSWRDGALYGGELLAEFLARAGVSGSKTVKLGRTPSGAKVVVAHTSSQPLESVLRGMLEHSNNFTANQLFLTLGIKKFGSPATLEKAQRAMT